jgi:DnaJ-class molecular chaperone
VVQEDSHPVFQRDGADLIFKVQIPLVKSLAGFSIDLQTLDKRVLCIPVTDIVQTGDTMVIDGEGLPTGEGGKGCLVVEFEVLFPKVLSETQKKIIRSGFYLPSETTATQQKHVETYLGSFSHSTEGWSVGFSK